MTLARQPPLPGAELEGIRDAQHGPTNEAQVVAAWCRAQEKEHGKDMGEAKVCGAANRGICMCGRAVAGPPCSCTLVNSLARW